MTDTKHTPGPWTVVRVKEQKTGWRGIHIADKDGGAIANIVMQLDDKEQANARVLAAAPDLLAALEAAYIKFGDWTFDWPGRIEPSGQVLLSQMRDAIAASTGRTPQDVQDDYGTRAHRAAISKAEG